MKGTATAGNRTLMFVAILSGPLAGGLPTDPALAGKGPPVLSTSNLSVEGGMLFQTEYDERSREGDLIARRVDRHGNAVPDEHYPFDPGEPGYVAGREGEIRVFHGAWRAGRRVTAQSRRAAGGDNRTIFTSGVDNSGVTRGLRFRWNNAAGDSLTDSMKTVINPGTNLSALRDPVVDWTRGYDIDESDMPGDPRRRHTVLGNLTHNRPLYIGPPAGFHPDPGYEQFRLANRHRLPIVVAGGSDGMVHAFRADNGDELFGYIPSGALAQLKRRLGQNYVDQPLASGPLSAGDVYGDFPQCSDSPCWRSLLVGGMGDGGRSVFALDVTNPATDMGDIDPEANAARKLFLWEFTHGRLGLATSKPLAARLGDGTWVVIFGSGRESGAAVLFVLDAATGALRYEIEVPSESGANGLSSPTAWDTDHDGAIDSIYAGDLEGNLWKFDFSDISNARESPSAPVIGFSGHSLVRVGRDEPGASRLITTTPLVTEAGDRALGIFFVTGGDADRTASVFGITDKGESLGERPVFSTRTLKRVEYVTGANPASAGSYRVIDSISNPDHADGWRLVLPRGERIVGDPALNNGRIEFMSTSVKSPHRTESWYTGMDYRTGVAPTAPFLDIDADGELRAGDVLNDVNNDGEFTIDDDRIPVGLLLGDGKASAASRAITAGGMESLFYSIDTASGSSEGSGDPGVPGGSFDQLTFDWSPEQFDACSVQQSEDNAGICTGYRSCWGVSPTCHSSGYDDEWDVDGVNMLHDGGEVTNPPDVESATGILDFRQKALVEAISEEHNGAHGSGLRHYLASTTDEITIRIRNPNSVDNRELADHRIAAGIDSQGSAPAPPPTIYFNCDRDRDGLGDDRIRIDAPGFNLLPLPARTCVIKDITELRVRHHSINALRATGPDCVTSNDTTVPAGALGDPAAPHPNSGYRNGAFTVQAVSTGRRTSPNGEYTMTTSAMAAGIVIWESVSFENLGEDCSAANETLRSEPTAQTNPGAGNPGGGGTGDEDEGTNPPSNEGGGESTVPKPIHTAAKFPPDGRVSWREVPE